MAMMEVHFFSDCLRHAVNVNVILPEESKHLIGMETSAEKTCRTLYLLHGLSDDHTIWCRRTSVERYVANRNMAVVMPDVSRSWYTDSKAYGLYQTFVSEELPRVMHGFFRCISDKREDTFIAGLSMGGYGALKIGLSNPDRYRAIAAFSSATDIVNHGKNASEEWNAVFSDSQPLKGSKNDLFQLAKDQASAPVRPSIYQWCGTEDFLIEENRSFRDLMTSLPYDFTYAESTGKHEWVRWDEQIQVALDFFDQLTKADRAQ